MWNRFAKLASENPEAHRNASRAGGKVRGKQMAEEADWRDIKKTEIINKHDEGAEANRSHTEDGPDSPSQYAG